MADIHVEFDELEALAGSYGELTVTIAALASMVPSVESDGWATSAAMQGFSIGLSRWLCDLGALHAMAANNVAAALDRYVSIETT
jgi:hypothetical protein